MHKKIKKILALVVLVSGLAGCSGGISNGVKQARTYEKRHPIILEKKQDTLEIPVSSTGDISLQESQIKSFLYTYDNYGKSNLVITAPETGVESGTARVALKNIIEIAQKVGIKKDSIKIGTYQSLDKDNLTIRMNFKKIIAKASDCSNNWSENLVDAYHNELWKGHGCSTRKNLTAMIADPEDLVRMPTIGSGNSARRVEVFNKYILGQGTGAAQEATASATDQ